MIEFLEPLVAKEALVSQIRRILKNPASYRTRGGLTSKPDRIHQGMNCLIVPLKSS